MKGIWLPLANEALDRHGLRLTAGAVLGPGGTFPAVVSDTLVVKFFGHEGEWRATWANEKLARPDLVTTCGCGFPDWWPRASSFRIRAIPGRI